MKKSKIIAPALGVLILSTAASISGTVAWFSANSKVDVTGMLVKAKTDSSYLLVANNASLTNDTGANPTNIAGTTFDMAIHGTTTSDPVELFPVSYTASAIQSTGDNPTTIIEANKWFTASGTSNTDGTAKAGTLAQLTIAEANNKGSVTASSKDYYVYSEFYIGLATGSVAATAGQGLQADVKFTATQESALNQCLTVLVVYNAAANTNPTAPAASSSDASVTQKYVYNASTGAVTVKATSLQADSILPAAGTGTKVKVYAFFDGEHAACTTANAVNLAGITVELSFFVNEDLHVPSI